MTYADRVGRLCINKAHASGAHLISFVAHRSSAIATICTTIYFLPIRTSEGIFF